MTREPAGPDGRRLDLPELSLVLLLGASGSGKSTFAQRHFSATEIVSSDVCRALVADDETDQSASRDAFDVLHLIVAKRLERGLLTVVDATNAERDKRQLLLRIAQDHDVQTVAIVLDVPERVCVERDSHRPPGRRVGVDAIRRQRMQLLGGLGGLDGAAERITAVHHLRDADKIDRATIRRTPFAGDLRDHRGPFDVIGDVHGCRAELEALLQRLGYTITRDDAGRPIGARNPGRRAVFVGDLVDRGPDSPGVLRLVMGMAEQGDAFCVSGNHEAKLVRALDGERVHRTPGLGASLDQFAAETTEFRGAAQRFMASLVSHYVLDGGRLVVAHAGLIEKYHGRTSGRVRSFCLYGQTTGRLDEAGRPERLPWANEYTGTAMVLYGHTPGPAAEWVNGTLCLDTGCVFGGQLTALRYPEREVVSVPAARVYVERPVPFLAGSANVHDHQEVGGS